MCVKAQHASPRIRFCSDMAWLVGVTCKIVPSVPEMTLWYLVINIARSG